MGERLLHISSSLAFEVNVILSVFIARETEAGVGYVASSRVCGDLVTPFRSLVC